MAYALPDDDQLAARVLMLGIQFVQLLHDGVVHEPLPWWLRWR
jgi:hypothetical protein